MLSLTGLKSSLRGRISNVGRHAAASELEAQILDLRHGYEKLASEATEWRQGYDGYRAAFEASCADAARARVERDRLLETICKVNYEKRPVPPGLAGRQLCFLHIGKTAGTSLQHALFEVASDVAIFHDSLSGFDSVSATELALNDVVIGHFTYQHVRKMRPARFLMTFLRDPVDRVVSNYHFLRTNSPVSNYSEAALRAACSLALKDFLLCRDPNVRMVTENFQTKVLAFDFRPNHLEPPMRGALRENAERNLATFDFIGITEYFDDSLRVLSEMLGVELSVKKLNVNPDRPGSPPSAEELDIARSLNRLDLGLYDKARSTFERLYLVPRLNGAALAGCLAGDGK
jgi:galactose-3-O-sulfotransferase